MLRRRRNSNRTIHENYHKKTRSFKKIIKNNNFTYRTHLEIINNYIKPPKTILDIGCGAGAITLYLANKGNIVTGTDISQKAISECLKSAKELNINKIQFLRADFQKAKINKKFDVVILTEVIEHLPDDHLALKSIYRFLKPNGILILSTPSIKAPLHKLGLTKKFDKEVGHLRRYNLDQLKKLLKNEDFKIIYIKQTEGIMRNFLFINPLAGKLVRFIKFFLSDWITFIDNISLRLFGPSNYIIVARRVDSKQTAKK